MMRLKKRYASIALSLLRGCYRLKPGSDEWISRQIWNLSILEHGLGYDVREITGAVMLCSKKFDYSKKYRFWLQDRGGSYLF